MNMPDESTSAFGSDFYILDSTSPKTLDSTSPKTEELAMEQKKDYTVVMVTHNIQQPVHVSDSTAFFLLGEVVEQNDAKKLCSIPADKQRED